MSIGLESIGAALSVGVAMTVAGALPLYQGWRRRDRYHLVRDTPTETPATATASETVLLRGTATARERPIDAPMTGDDALLAAWSIREWQDENMNMKHWTPEARGLQMAGVRIEADGSAITVPDRSHEATTDVLTSLVGYDAITGFEIDDALVEFDEFDTAEEVPQGIDPPERFRDLERRVGLDASQPGATLIDLGRTHGTREYREAVVGSGDTLTVRGTVRQAKEPGVGRVLETPEDGPAIVSDLDADALEQRYRRSYRILFYGMICVILLMMLIAGLVVAV